MGPRLAEGQVEGPRVRDVREEEADDLAPVEIQFVVGLAVHEKQVAEAPHQRVGGPLLPPGEKPPVVGDQEIVEHEDLLPVHRCVPLAGRRLDQHVSVEPEVLLHFLAVVGVVPVEAGIREEDPVFEAPAGGHRVLGQVGYPVEGVVEAHPVPVDRGGPRRLVLEVDEDRGVLVHVDERAGVLPVEPVHHVVAAVDAAAHPAREQVERLAVPEAHDLGGDGVGKRFIRRHPRQEGKGFRPQVSESRNHGGLGEHGSMGPRRFVGGGAVSHRGMVHRRRPALAAAADRHHEVVVRKDPGGRGGPAQGEAAGAGLDRGRGLGAHQDHELVERHRSEGREGSIPDLPEPDHRMHDRGGRPGDPVPVIAEGRGLGQALDFEVEAVALVSVAGYRNSERARVPTQEGGSPGGSEIRGRVEGDAVQARGAPGLAVRGWGNGLLRGCRARRSQDRREKGVEGNDATALDAPFQNPSLPTGVEEIRVVS